MGFVGIIVKKTDTGISFLLAWSLAREKHRSLHVRLERRVATQAES
jgi:hypothetical protein